MSILCKIGLHKWKILEKKQYVYKTPQWSDWEGKRVCERCGLKQRYAVINFSWDNGKIGWVKEDEPTPYEVGFATAAADLIEDAVHYGDAEAVAKKLLPCISDAIKKKDDGNEGD